MNSDNDTIKKQISCQDDYDPESITPDEANRQIRSAMQRLNESETVPVRKSLNRILAEDIISKINVPSHTN